MISAGRALVVSFSGVKMYSVVILVVSSGCVLRIGRSAGQVNV